MKHLKTPLKIRTLGLAAVLAGTALGACASTSKTPAVTEPTVVAETPAIKTEGAGQPAAMSTSTGTLVLNVSGYKEQSGQIMVAVYNDAQAFDDEAAPLRSDQVAVSGAQTTVAFDKLSVGEYAFKVFHDANGNGELDTNAFGLPTEKYGFSMDASDPFSAPEFEESKFSLTSGENIRNVSLD